MRRKLLELLQLCACFKRFLILSSLNCVFFNTCTEILNLSTLQSVPDMLDRDTALRILGQILLVTLGICHASSLPSAGTEPTGSICMLKIFFNKKY